MSVTFPRGFRAGAAAAGLKSSGALDVCVVVNDGDNPSAAAVFTSNKVSAAPVRWSRRVIAQGDVRAVVLNSGGANACTGQQGVNDAAEMASLTSAQLGLTAMQVAVCSTGLIGQPLPMTKLRVGIETAVDTAATTAESGAAASLAIMTTDSVPKLAQFEATRPDGSTWRIGGMAKGAGMLAPGLATMLVVVTTDVEIDASSLQAALTIACARTFNRLDSDGCMSTNDTVIALASGATGRVPSQEFVVALHAVCFDLMQQLQHDAEGSTKDIAICVSGAMSESDAEAAARSIARSSLLKCAVHGEDPNWGRVLAALGTCDVHIDPDRIDVSLNGVWVCRDSQSAAHRDAVVWAGRAVTIDVDLKVGNHSATVWTNDLTAMYVHENSAYSS